MPLRLDTPVMLRRRHALAAVLVAACAARGSAQTVRGTVVSEGASLPVPGAIVLLTDSAGSPLARTLVDASGAFVLRAPAAGRYGVRTLRIGFRPSVFGPYDVPASGLSGLTLAVRDVRVSLAPVRVTDRGECVRADGAETASEAIAVWEEARKALLGSVLTRGAERLDLTTIRYERVADSRTRRVMRQTVERRAGQATRPFVSALAPEQYAARGFRTADAVGRTFHAPDADVLLSTSFASTHCLGVALGGTAGEVGVSFAPTATRPRQVDGAPLVEVAGTLWLDRRTAELRRLEYRYTGLEPPEDEARGSIAFLRLPTGHWVVEQWDMHMPRVEVTRTGAKRVGSVTIGARETRAVKERWTYGGLLADARHRDSTLWRRPLPFVVGTLGTASGGAVGGATISLSGTTYAAVTDSLGRFRLDDLLPGEYDASVRTPDTDVFGLPAVPVGVVTATTDSSHSVRLFVERADAALAQQCGRAAVERELSFLRGMVRDAGGRPSAGAVVRATWTQSRADGAGSAPGAGVAGSDLGFETTTDDAGEFGLCNVPRGRDVALSARSPDGTLATPAPRVLRLGREQAAARVALALAPVVVAAARPAEMNVILQNPAPSSAMPDLTGFERRRRTGNGIFVTEEDIARRRLVSTDQIFNFVSNMKVIGGVVVMDRGRVSLRDPCAGAQILVDGALMPEVFRINNVALVDIRGMEIYTGPANMPAELRTPKSTCGTVAIWTR